MTMTIDEWLAIVIKNNWCSDTVCSTHDSLPMTEEEEEAFDEGSDPCVHVVRLYEPGTFHYPESGLIFRDLS